MEMRETMKTLILCNTKVYKNLSLINFFRLVQSFLRLIVLFFLYFLFFRLLPPLFREFLEEKLREFFDVGFSNFFFFS